MPNGTVPIWAKPKYIIPSFKCKFLLYHIIEPCYLRVAKQYQMVVRCSLAGILRFLLSSHMFHHLQASKLYCSIICLLGSIFSFSSDLVQFFMLSLGGSPQQYTGWAMCWIAWIPFGKCIYLPAGFITTFWAEVHCPTCSDVHLVI